MSLLDHQSMPEFEGSPVVAAAPLAEGQDERLVLLESWDYPRRRVVWILGTIGEDPTTEQAALAVDESFDNFQEALVAYASALQLRVAGRPAKSDATDPTVPRFPEGTPEYEAYRLALRAELQLFAAGLPPYEEGFPL